MANKRLYLSGIKGYAFLLVFAWHIEEFLPFDIPKTGNIGVELFIVLSGFLVALNYYDSDSLNKSIVENPNI